MIGNKAVSLMATVANLAINGIRDLIMLSGK